LAFQVTDAGLYWDKELITQRELPERLAAYVRRNKNPSIWLAGDDFARYGPTVAALDEVRLAGITQVQVETFYRATGQ
jgi:biopolymer transport protein ExbD